MLPSPRRSPSTRQPASSVRSAVSTARSTAFSLALGAAVAFAPASAFAAPHDFAIYTLRLGGEPETAQPYIDRMAAHLEQKTGWAKGSMHGTFLTSRKTVQEFIDSKNPGFGFVEPWLYFELRKSHKLTLLVQVASKDLNANRFHVVVKDPAVKTLADLKGKRLWTHLAESPRYLSNIVLDGKQAAESHFQLKQTGNALKAARAVLRGEADACLLDDEQWEMAKKLDGGAGLHVVYESAPQPVVSVVAFGGGMPPTEQSTLTRALLTLCSDAGATICKEMHLDKMLPPDTKLYDAAARRFDGAPAPAAGAGKAH